VRGEAQVTWHEALLKRRVAPTSDGGGTMLVLVRGSCPHSLCRGIECTSGIPPSALPEDAKSTQCTLSVAPPSRII